MLRSESPVFAESLILQACEIVFAKRKSMQSLVEAHTLNTVPSTTNNVEGLVFAVRSQLAELVHSILLANPLLRIEPRVRVHP